MSLNNTKQALQWAVVMESLRDANVDAETVALVESARASHKTWMSMASALMGTADTAQAKNYVKVEVHGLVAPFERAYVELVRPGGKTSHELRELLRERLLIVRDVVRDLDSLPSAVHAGVLNGAVEGINKALAKRPAGDRARP